MKKRLLIFSICLLLVSGCSNMVKSPIELIKKPQLPVSQKIPREIISENVPKGYKLVRPHVSNALSSVDYIDWDNDGVEEVYAFYSNKEKASSGLMIIDKQKDTWQLKTSIEALGSDVSYAEFIDLNRDGIKDVILGLTMPGETVKSLLVYEWQEQGYIQIYKDVYTEIVIEDIDGDLSKDILILKLDRNSSATATLIKYLSNEMMAIDQIEMDEYINGYYNVVFGKASEDVNGVFVDKKIGSKSATNIILYIDGKLRLAFDEFDKTDRYKHTIKDLPIPSKDIDDDGIIEIGNVMLSHLNSKEDIANAYLHTWYKWVGYSTLVLQKMNYINEDEGYRLDFPERWANSIINGKIGIIKSKPAYNRQFLNICYTPSKNRLYNLLTIEIVSEKKYVSLIAKLKSQDIKYYHLGKSETFYYIGYNQTKLTMVPEQFQEIYQTFLLPEYEMRALFQLIK